MKYIQDFTNNYNVSCKYFQQYKLSKVDENFRIKHIYNMNLTTKFKKYQNM